MKTEITRKSLLDAIHEHGRATDDGKLETPVLSLVEHFGVRNSSKVHQELQKLEKAGRVALDYKSTTFLQKFPKPEAVRLARRLKIHGEPRMLMSVTLRDGAIPGRVNHKKPVEILQIALEALDDDQFRRLVQYMQSGRKFLAGKDCIYWVKGGRATISAVAGGCLEPPNEAIWTDDRAPAAWQYTFHQLVGRCAGRKLDYLRAVSQSSHRTICAAIRRAQKTRQRAAANTEKGVEAG